MNKKTSEILRIIPFITCCLAIVFFVGLMGVNKEAAADNAYTPTVKSYDGAYYAGYLLDSDSIKDFSYKINMTDMNIYSLMVKPTNGLYISYTAMKTAGRRAVRSPIVTRLLKLFPKLEIEEWRVGDDIAPAPEPAFDELLKGLNKAKNGMELSESMFESYYWFKENALYKQSILFFICKISKRFIYNKFNCAFFSPFEKL